MAHPPLLARLGSSYIRTTLQIRTVCEEYSTAKEEIDRVPEALQEASQ
jgi:hypothetical protein